MSSESDRFSGRVLNGTFVVDEPIGAGGMGTVYAAHNSKTPGIRYAVKVLRADGSPASETEAERFRREAQVLATLDHPAIVRPVHADVTAEGEPYLVMELVRGVSLRQRLASALHAGTHLSLPLVVAVLDGIADALDHAHSRGIVHRDLKPENVMVLETGRAVLVKILDFGIAKIFQRDGVAVDTITRTQEVAGTVSYMSPEQCKSLGSAGDASDRYSLGVIAYELLTGKRPFDAGNAAATICNILLNPMPPASALRPDLSPKVDAVLARMCAKAPEARFARCEAFVTALAEALGQPLASGPLRISSSPALGPISDPSAIATDETLDASGASNTQRGTDTEHPGRESRATGKSFVRIALARARPRARAPSVLAIAAIVGTAAAASSAVVYLVARREHHGGGSALAGSPVPCPGRPREPTPGLYDDEVCIPGGTFRMGTPQGEGEHDEHPAHTVTLDPFYIDRYEVTVARYRRCVAAGACDPRGLDTEGPYNEHNDYAARGTRFRASPHCTFRANPSTNDTRPINCLSYAQAEQICRFEGRRLPTEAEWERAARGVQGRTYPWGEEQPDCNRASYGYGAGCGLAEPVPVGTARGDATPEGVFDLAGNVAEWTADWYAVDSYAHASTRNPLGATIEQAREHGGDALICQDGCRVTRGGTWVTALGMVSRLRGAHRSADAPNRRATTLGVRCARSAH